MDRNTNQAIEFEKTGMDTCTGGQLQQDDEFSIAGLPKGENISVIES
jgi:hypothetical protein